MLLKRVATCAHHVEAQCKKIYDKIANSSICLERQYVQKLTCSEPSVRVNQQLGLQSKL